jgi:hypothetical protein
MVCPFAGLSQPIQAEPVIIICDKGDVFVVSLLDHMLSLPGYDKTRKTSYADLSRLPGPDMRDGSKGRSAARTFIVQVRTRVKWGRFAVRTLILAIILPHLELPGGDSVLTHGASRHKLVSK